MEASEAMKCLVVALLLFSAVCVRSQTAEVIALDFHDAEEARALYAKQAAVEKQIADFKKMVDEKYLLQQFPYKANACICPLEGECNCPAPVLSKREKEEASKPPYRIHLPNWGVWEFSTDFKFIVPKKYEPKSGMGCMYLNSLTTDHGLVVAQQ
jgi:hypothetical protein